MVTINLIRWISYYYKLFTTYVYIKTTPKIESNARANDAYIRTLIHFPG
jgi:hypothetical protein